MKQAPVNPGTWREVASEFALKVSTVGFLGWILLRLLGNLL